MRLPHLNPGSSGKGTAGLAIFAQSGGRRKLVGLANLMRGRGDRRWSGSLLGRALQGGFMLNLGEFHGQLGHRLLLGQLLPSLGGGFALGPRRVRRSIEPKHGPNQAAPQAQGSQDHAREQRSLQKRAVIVWPRPSGQPRQILNENAVQRRASLAKEAGSRKAATKLKRDVFLVGRAKVPPPPKKRANAIALPALARRQTFFCRGRCSVPGWE